MKKIFEQEETPSFSKEKIEYDFMLTPTGASIDDVVAAFKNIDNYGIYISNMRNKASVNKAIEMHFGNMDTDGKKIAPAKKSSIEKQRGEKFPIKTKDAIDNFVKSLTSRPTLLNYEVKEDMLIFPKEKNPTKDLTKKIIKTVMDTAGISYKLKEKESIDEIQSLKNKLTESIIKKLRQ
jgi:hypothetical protein